MPLLEVENLHVGFPIAGRMIEVVRGVSFHVDTGQALGLAGESGSGKSQTALAILRLLKPPGRILSGRIRFEGVDLTRLDDRAMARLRGAGISIVFQDAMAALNPAFTIGTQLTDVIIAHTPRTTRRAARDTAVETLARVGIPDPRRPPRRLPPPILRRYAPTRRHRHGHRLQTPPPPRRRAHHRPRRHRPATDRPPPRHPPPGARPRPPLHHPQPRSHGRHRRPRRRPLRRPDHGRSPHRRPVPNPPPALHESPPRLHPPPLRPPRPVRRHRRRPPIAGQLGPGCPFLPRCPDRLPICAAERPPERQIGPARIACWAA